MTIHTSPQLSSISIKNFIFNKTLFFHKALCPIMKMPASKKGNKQQSDPVEEGPGGVAA